MARDSKRHADDLPRDWPTCPRCGTKAMFEIVLAKVQRSLVTGRVHHTTRVIAPAPERTYECGGRHTWTVASPQVEVEGDLEAGDD